MKFVYYFYAVILTLAALLLNKLLFYITDRNLFFLPLVVVVVSALLYGVGPALLALVISMLGLDYAVLGSVSGESIFVRLLLYFISGIGLIVLGNSLRTSNRRAKEASLARDEFISIVSHELGNPLGAIQLQTQIGKKYLKDSSRDDQSFDKISKTFDRIDDSIRKADRLLKDLLESSRARHGTLSIQVSKVNFPELIERILDHFKQELKAKNYSLSLELAPNIVGEWDPQRVEQIIVNLVSNAIKYGNGKPIGISLGREKNFAVFRINDHGEGISPENKKIIFDRFERVSQKKSIQGLGMGLYITKKLVELHGGTISVISDEKNTSFTVKLPVVG